MAFLEKLRKKFGRYAIHGLTKYIIAAYIIGYVLLLMSRASGSGILFYLSLNPGAIMHGQVWRLVTWLLTPPTSLDIFTIVMLFCYYQLGSVLERVWGDFFYNLYIFFGLAMTLISSFIIYYTSAEGMFLIESTGGMIFTTYYVSLSIFLGFAFTFPEQKMLLFFIIPIKIKYLAIFDIAYLVYSMFRTSFWTIRVQILCSMSSFIVLIILIALSKSKQKHRSASFKRAYDSGPKAAAESGGQTYKKAVSQGQAKAGYFHKCYICGQTDTSNPELEFRYCSKCNGNYEYCQNHLFTHEHIK
ncbi:MAG: hypothetical protein IKR00_04670 [Lachnospiraceae bacterium]|nr:hypothetical protein [Lachnospiraceae bacterium]